MSDTFFHLTHICIYKRRLFFLNANNNKQDEEYHLKAQQLSPISWKCLCPIFSFSAKTCICRKHTLDNTFNRHTSSTIMMYYFSIHFHENDCKFKLKGWKELCREVKVERVEVPDRIFKSATEIVVLDVVLWKTISVVDHPWLVFSLSRVRLNTMVTLYAKSICLGFRWGIIPPWGHTLWCFAPSTFRNL